MALSATRVRGHRPTEGVADTPAFHRRHRLLALLLALHLPGFAALAVVTGGEVHEVLVEAAVVVLALAVGAFLELSPRLRALALTAGLLWGSVVVGMLTATVIGGVLHAATVGLVAAAHVGASWRHLRVDAAQAGPERAEDDGPEEPAADDVAAAGFVEVREVYTGVWSARRLVRPGTRLIRLPDPPAEQDTADSAASAADVEAVSGPDGEPDPAAERPGPAEAGAGAAARRRDPDLTREVLEALHLGAVEEAPIGDAVERVTTGHPG